MDEGSCLKIGACPAARAARLVSAFDISSVWANSTTIEREGRARPLSMKLICRAETLACRPSSIWLSRLRDRHRLRISPNWGSGFMIAFFSLIDGQKNFDTMSLGSAL